MAWIDKARGGGHEVLMEVPMEPFDFPDSDPGPHTLRAGQDEDANIQRLTWALTRFTGYAGVTNLLGQRFLSDSAALSPAGAASPTWTKSSFTVARWAEACLSPFSRATLWRRSWQ